MHTNRKDKSKKLTNNVKNIDESNTDKSNTTNIYSNIQEKLEGKK